MFLHRRGFVILFVVAALVTGTAFASGKLARLFPASQMSADPLLAKTQPTNQRSAVGLRTQHPSDPQSSSDGAKSPRRHFTIYRNEQGEFVCREATPEEIRE